VPKKKRVYVLALIYFSAIIILLYSVAITTALFINTMLILGYFGFRQQGKVNWQYRLSFVSLFIIGIIAGIVIIKKLDVKDGLMEYNFEDNYVSGAEQLERFKFETCQMGNCLRSNSR